jgi:uncharacterized protein YbaR (Trm112 family)
LNKSDIEFCPFCQSILYVDDISECDNSEEDEFEIRCDFCEGVYRIIEVLESPLTKEQIRMKFMGIPLVTEKKKSKRKRKGRKKK